MRTLAILILALSASLSTPLASATELKIGYVSIDKLLSESALAKKANGKLDKEFKTRELDIQKSMKQGRDLQTYLEKEGLTLSEAERAKKQKELADVTYSIQKSQRELREDFNRRRNEEVGQLLDQARKIIQDIAKKEHYDLIVDNVVHASPRVDITERVLTALDK